MQTHIESLLNEAGIGTDIFKTAQILCLPENILTAGKGEELLETTDIDSLAKALREAGVNVFTFMDAGFDLAAMDRRSGDKWLGTVWVRDIVAIPFLIAVVAGMCVVHYDKYVKEAKHPSEPTASPQVHIKLLVDKAHGQTELQFTGDGETLIKVLKTLKEDAGQQ